LLNAPFCVRTAGSREGGATGAAASSPTKKEAAPDGSSEDGDEDGPKELGAEDGASEDENDQARSVGRNQWNEIGVLYSKTLILNSRAEIPKIHHL